MKTALPDIFPITPDMRNWAELKVPIVDIDREHDAFCDYWYGNGRKMVKWDAVWRNWMRRCPQFGGATHPPDRVYLTNLKRQYAKEGFRQPFPDETSGTYKLSYERWRDRFLPTRDIASLFTQLRQRKE